MATRVMPILILLVLFGCGSQKTEHKRSKADIYYTHGTSNLMKKNYTEALNLLLKAEAERPTDTKIHNNLGMAYFFKKRSSRAVFHLKRAIELDSKNSDAKNNLASVFLQMGRYQEAKELYTEVSRDLVYHHQYRVYYNLALISLKEGKPMEAISHLEQSVSEKDDYCPAQFKLGELAERQRNYNAALLRFKKASLGTCVSLPAPHYHQALNLIRLKRYRDAQAKLEIIIEKFATSRYSLLATEKLREIKNLGNFEITKESVLRDYENRKKQIKSYNSTSF